MRLMLRSQGTNFVALTTTVCLTAMLAPGVQAQWRQNFDNWRQDRQQRYQQWRSGSQERADSVRGLVDLFSNDVEPGQYDVRLPLGVNLRVNVNEEQREYRGGRAPHTIDAVVTLGAEMQQSLRHMQARARRFDDEELEERIEEALDELEDVLDAGRSDASLADLRERTSDFDDAWHDLETYLHGNQQLGPRFRREIGHISELDDRMHRTVSISPSRGYDRLEAVAVIRRLQQQTDRLQSDLEYRVEPGAGIGRVLRNVRDTHQQADDLFEAIQQGESYEAVRQEYQQFDRAWHDTLELARHNQQLGRRMWEQHQEIDQLDTRLHDILNVESPLGQGKQTWVDRSRSLAMSSEDLLRYTQNADLRGELARRLRYAAEDVAVAANDFYQWFEAGNRDMAEARERVNRIAEQWDAWRDQLSALGDSRNRQLFQLSEQVDQKLQRLETRFAS